MEKKEKEEAGTLYGRKREAYEPAKQILEKRIQVCAQIKWSAEYSTENQTQTYNSETDSALEIVSRLITMADRKVPSKEKFRTYPYRGKSLNNPPCTKLTLSWPGISQPAMHPRQLRRTRKMRSKQQSEARQDCGGEQHWRMDFILEKCWVP